MLKNVRLAGLVKPKTELQSRSSVNGHPLQRAVLNFGVHFSYNKALAEKENFYDLSLDCRTPLNIWKQRWLSKELEKFRYLSLWLHLSLYMWPP